MHPANRSQSAFSLVELSIVLVILGLLVGGVLAGQSLIRASELRAVVTEYQKWLGATQAFRDRYFALPGDMSNATKFWTAQDPVAANCATTASAGAATCDGDGDGVIEVLGAAGAPAGSNEIFRFWQHLANAGLIEGSFSGIKSGTTNYATVFGTNSPASKLGSGGWGMYMQGVVSGDSRLYDMNYGQAMYFGAALVNNVPNTAVLKPEEAWNIDTKLDDGKPASGKVMAVYWNNACAAADDGSSASSDLVASYRLSTSSVQCGLIFPNFP